MADIDVQRKKQPIWPWILGILGAIILIWILIEAFGTDDRAGRHDEDTRTGLLNGNDKDMPMPRQVNNYVKWVADEDRRRDRNDDFPDYVEDGFSKLSDALVALKKDENAGRNPRQNQQNSDNTWEDQIDNRVDSLREQAGRIEDDDHAGQRAALTRQAAMNGVEAMQMINQHKNLNADNHIQQMLQAAQSIQQNQQLNQQIQQVDQYFRAAAETFRAIYPEDEINRDRALQHERQDQTRDAGGTPPR